MSSSTVYHDTANFVYLKHFEVKGVYMTNFIKIDPLA